MCTTTRFSQTTTIVLVHNGKRRMKLARSRRTYRMQATEPGILASIWTNTTDHTFHLVGGSGVDSSWTRNTTIIASTWMARKLWVLQITRDLYLNKILSTETRLRLRQRLLPRPNRQRLDRFSPPVQAAKPPKASDADNELPLAPRARRLSTAVQPFVLQRQHASVSTVCIASKRIKFYAQRRSLGNDYRDAINMHEMTLSCFESCLFFPEYR